jgi:hypothetical protein
MGGLILHDGSILTLMASRQHRMTLSVASMVVDVLATDCKLIVAVAGTWSRDTKLSRPGSGTGMLVGIPNVSYIRMK